MAPLHPNQVHICPNLDTPLWLTVMYVVLPRKITCRSTSLSRVTLLRRLRNLVAATSLRKKEIKIQLLEAKLLVPTIILPWTWHFPVWWSMVPSEVLVRISRSMRRFYWSELVLVLRPLLRESHLVLLWKRSRIDLLFDLSILKTIWYRMNGLNKSKPTRLSKVIASATIFFTNNT